MKIVVTIIDSVQTAANLKQLMKDSGISIKEYVDMLCLSSSGTIYRWWRNETIPELETLLSLSYILQQSLDNILVYSTIEKDI